jgi:hypothetical protein
MRSAPVLVTIPAISIDRTHSYWPDCSHLATPVHATLASILFLIEIAGGTRGIVHNGTWLKAIRQDNVGIHGTHVQMINVGPFHTFGPVAKHLQLFDNLTANLYHVKRVKYSEQMSDNSIPFQAFIPFVPQRN